MKTTPLSEINQLEEGELVMRVEGEITRVFDRKSGTKNDKDWAIQNLILRDDSGEVRVGVWNHPDLSSLGGKKVSVIAHKSDKGFSGVYCELNDYKGKVTKQLRLTASAQIERLDGQSKSSDADSGNREATGARPNTQRALTPPKEHPNDSTGFDDLLQQICNAQYLIFKAEKHRWEQMIPDGMVPEFDTLVGNAHFQADCSSAFIKLDRAGEVEKLSTAPIWREKGQQEKEW